MYPHSVSSLTTITNMGEKQPQDDSAPLETVSLSVEQVVPGPSSENAEKADNNAPPTPTNLPSLPKDDLVRKLLGVFAVASAMSIFLWFMAGAGFPWFIYIVYSVALINCIIYGVKTKNSFFVNWTISSDSLCVLSIIFIFPLTQSYIYASTNLMLFLTFLATGGGYPWFMIPACSMAIIPVAQYIYRTFPANLRWLYIHAALYVIINTMLFFIWMTNSLHDAYPWFIYPWGGWGIFLLIQYNHVVMHDRSRLFILICADIGVMLMITFRFAIGPLFMIFVLIGLLGVVLYYVFLKKGYIAHCWCVKRAGQPTLPTTQPPQNQVPTQAQPQPQGPFYNLPQFHVQFQPPSYHTPVPPGAVYYPGPHQNPQFQTTPVAVPSYYAYFPSNNATVPVPEVPASESRNLPTSPNDAVLTSDVVSEEKGKGKAKGEDDEEGHLLRNSPTRTYYISPPNDK